MTSTLVTHSSRGTDVIPRVLFVSIYPDLTNTAREFSQELDVPMDIIEGGIHSNGHLFARDMQDKYDVIISQAGTALSIQNLVNIPVISVKLTVRDFLNAFEEATSYKNPLALISYKGETQVDIEDLAKSLTEGKFESFVYACKDDFLAIIPKVMSLKDHTILGFGGCVAKHAQEHDRRYTIIRSSRDNIRQAVLSAKNIMELNIKEKIRARRLNNIVNYSREGIISVDKNDTITICNLPAKRMLKLRGEQVVGSVINPVSAPPTLCRLYGNGKFTLNELVTLGEKSFLVSRVPVSVQAKHQETVITFQELLHIQKMEVQARMQLHMKGMVAKYNFKNIIARSTVMRDIISKARQFSKTAASILVEGETGTGKELFAQSIHNESLCKHGPFVAINCAALPEHLLESELFGYEEGAFTGAKKGGKAGLFEMAHNGTIFLDEIGEVSLGIQSRLLRVLQEKEVLRVGGDRIINIDARIIAATNKNLYKCVLEGHFRRDLFFRLNILTLNLAPLRNRVEDIGPLVEHFIEAGNRRYGKQMGKLSEQALHRLQSYSWPGNIRELEHFVERMVVLYTPESSLDALMEDTLQAHLEMFRDTSPPSSPASDEALIIEKGTMKEMEERIFRELLKQNGGNKQRLADELGLSRVTVWKKLKELEE